MFFGTQPSAETILFRSNELTLYRLALFCKQAYEKIPQPEVAEWVFLSKSVPNGQGYYGVAYIHRTKPWMVIAHRGTDTALMSNLLSDVSIAFSSLPKAQQYAKAFSEEVRAVVSPDYLIIETGHSLGGFHAEMNVAVLRSGYAMTFESPGSGEMCDMLSIKPNPDAFLSFFSIPDAINTAKPHIGPLYQICAYRMDNQGLLVSPSSYLMPLTQALLKSKTPIDSAANAGLSVLTTTISEISKRQFLHHSLDGLITAMHPQVGYPWLMRKMTSWPILTDFLQTQASGSALASVPNASAPSVGFSEETSGYVAGEFVCAPQLENTLHLIARSYRINALKRFEAFFQGNHALRATFIQQMRLSEEEVKIAETTTYHEKTPSEQKGTEFTATASISQKPSVQPRSTLLPQASPQTAAAPISCNMPNEKSVEKVIIANSLLSDRLLIEESQWRISLVKSPGEQEHAFLLLEGIKEGAPVHVRSDLFVDSKSVVAGSVGCAFVRTKALTKEEYQKLLGGCEYQSWPITQQKAETLIERITQEAQKPVGTYKYSIVPGNTSSRGSSRASGLHVYNCVAWCQDRLKEVGITVGSRWALAEYPSQVVRKAIQENAAQPQKTASSSSISSSSFFSSSSGSSQQQRARGSTPSSTQPESNSGASNASLASLFASKGY